jgi:glycosyltransferase involved in cell wall biosynthesis
MERSRTVSNRIQNFVADSLHPSHAWPNGGAVKRADLHCHSNASNEADEAVLNAIACPESFSAPIDVYDQSKRRKMDFCTITDHDSIDGVNTILDRSDVLIGEELTCYFPEDRCKIHLLIWGITAGDHAALQAVANDIYQVAEIVEQRNIAHAVAHAVYRQNDRLERWHLERLVLMFKGFETLNGAHSVLHRQALEPLLDELTPQKIGELAAEHGMSPRWAFPHIKARTGGSDDHGLFNIGRTWTEFPGDVNSIDDLLDCIRTARCRPGGEAGSSLKLAHNIYGVGIRFYGRKIRGENEKPTVTSMMLDALIGEKRNIRKRDWVAASLKSKARNFGRRLVRPFRKPTEARGASLLMELFAGSVGQNIAKNDVIAAALRNDFAPLGEHAAIFQFLSSVNRDIAGGIAESVKNSIGRGEVGGIFDSLSSIAAHQFCMLPYYFSLFHQNRERHLLRRITGHGRDLNAQGMKLGVFTDTFDEVNGVARFIQDMSRQARLRERTLIVHTCSADAKIECASRKNFAPLLHQPMPLYPDQPFNIPPVIEVLEWADRQQFDAIHVHTPGPMGLCGWLVAKMLRVPVLGTYHTDFPQYVHNLTGGDHRMTAAATGYMKWFYGETRMILSRSKDYRGRLRELGFGTEKLAMTLPGVDTEKFAPNKRDLSLWKRLDVAQTYKLLYAGRVSVEKNLPFLVDAFKKLCARRGDVALVIAGDGPYLAKMKEALRDLPVKFLGYQNDVQLGALYASSDLFVFPSKTDTLGQVVIEAQAGGLPVLVSDHGGPKEVMDDTITGQVLSVDDPSVWTTAIDDLLNDTTRRQRMSRTATQRMARFSLGHTFEAFWDEHVKAAVESSREQGELQTAESADVAEVAMSV